MTIKELEQRINKLEQELAELKKVKIEEPKRWKPSKNEEYWYIDAFGDILIEKWGCDSFDNWVYEQENCFKTHEEAKHYKRKLEVKAIYKNYILENSEPLDWDNDLQIKYYIHKIGSIIGFDYNTNYKIQGVIYASSEKIIQQALNLIPKEDIYMLFEE